MTTATTTDPKDRRMDTTVVRSTRFGEIEIPTEAVLDFPSGLIGLGGRRYALLARSEDSAFVWLHSLEDPDLAVPVTNPWRFFDRFEVEISDEDAARMGLTGTEDTSVYVTVRAGETPQDLFANLKAPIIVHEGAGHQVINLAPDSPMRAPLFELTGTEASQAA